MNKFEKEVENLMTEFISINEPYQYKGDKKELIIDISNNELAQDELIQSLKRAKQRNETIVNEIVQKQLKFENENNK